MTRRRRVVLATFLCVVVIALVAFAAQGWIVQTTEAIAFATPTPTIDVGDIIAPDVFSPYNDALQHRQTGRAAPQSFP